MKNPVNNKEENTKKPITQLLALSLVAYIMASGISYAGKPKLLLGILIDGLQQETLDMLRPHFKKNGFNLFLNDGYVIDNLDFGSNVDKAAATAIVMTGAAPNVNGIGSEFIYDPSAKRVQHIFNDNSTLGNFTQETLSPNALRVSTISDEARIAGAGVTYVHSIAPNSAQALIMGSHAGNSAVWFNDKTGNWASSVYYKEMPLAAVNANRTQPLAQRVDTFQWQPSPITAIASNLPNHLIKYPFRYTFSSKDPDKYAKFGGTPLINQEITKLAKDYVQTLELGSHEGLDVLNIAYTLQPYEWSKSAEDRYEIYDGYIKLDESLSQLIELIDKKIGRDNAVIYISGTPGTSVRKKDDKKWNLPSGEFSSRKALSLLNLYLIALHGNGEWVTGFHKGHFYLNHELAKNLEKDINVIRLQAAECLMRMAGIEKAYTIDNLIQSGIFGSSAEGKIRNTIIGQSGDIIIELLPGWSLIDDFNFPNQKPTVAAAKTNSTAPFLLYAPGLQQKRVQFPVDARVVAPTISGILHIRPPNGAETPGILLH